ncbi:hypothetical protein LTR86_009033 [Recurvomyces mirabilis]|nr:hypothetical protein LTR86_009033 [Recurvomyces mirabilis]
MTLRTLITFLIATFITAALIIVASVFGRVTAMWMASQVMENKPVIHHVVENASQAEEYIEAMLRKSDVVAVIEGHIITDRRCMITCNKHSR